MGNIISVSRRTDIPAFYGDWFMNRLKAGCVSYPSSNSSNLNLVSLKPKDVNCFVFWSKNYQPFLDKLKIIEDKGYNSYFHFTITGLPKVFECNLVETDIAIDTVKTMSQMYSPKHISWRYDPIVISNETGFAYHLNRFKELASAMEGYVERCYFSYLISDYKKVGRNIDILEQAKGLSITDPTTAEKIDLANQLAEIANEHGITLHTCSADFLINENIKKAHCVDSDIIHELYPPTQKIIFKGLPTRKECGCAKSIDIGTYDTCLHGCVYCYATDNMEKAEKLYKKHDPKLPVFVQQKLPSVKSISGKNPILLIAPHGRKEDDTNTGKLTQYLANRLNCYALINEHYQRPPNNGTADPISHLLDLNNIDHIRKHLPDQFFDRILSLKNEIIEKHGEALVFFIHGVDDDNAKDSTGKNVDAFLGVGYPDRLTYDKKKIKSLAKALSKKHSIHTEIVKSGDYAGWDRENLNQLFNAPTQKHKKYKDVHVLSIQMEIKKAGFRDNKKNIEKTAERLSVALAELLGIELPEQVKSEEKGKEVVLLPKEVTPDITLVDKAYLTLADIFTRHYENALLEAGRYIINEFYDGNIALVKAEEPTKGHSLNQLIKRFQGREEGSPSRSWIFNAVNMVIDEEDFGAVQTYGQLKLSHKINLLPIKDEKQKTQLIEETIAKGYTIRQLKERIAETKPERDIGLNQIISKPDLLFNPDFSSYIDAKSIASLPPKKIAILRTKAQEQIDKIETEIANQRAYAKRYSELLRTIDKAANSQPQKSKKQKSIGYKEWTEKNINCCKGCSNNCLYCYARELAIRRHQVKDISEWGNCRIRQKSVDMKRKKYKYNRIGFPSTHDITPDNFEACYIVLGKLLEAGNDVLIVSKPNFECIQHLCDAYQDYKKNILFRFTIGAMDDQILSFWEPKAPSYEERKKSLEYAFVNGFQTSVSAEPLLDAWHVDDLVAELLPYITDALWIGKMNGISRRVEITDDRVKEAVDKIKAGQTDDNIKLMYAKYKDNPQIKWKGEIKKIVGIKSPDKPGMDV